MTQTNSATVRIWASTCTTTTFKFKFRDVKNVKTMMTATKYSPRRFYALLLLAGRVFVNLIYLTKL